MEVSQLNKELMSEYGLVMIQLEILNNKMLEIKKKIAEELNKKES
jgi:uncharacterized protein involved in exopolysaccharide biosynthesis